MSDFHEYHDFYFELEHRIRGVIPGHFKRDWVEDQITFNVLKSLRDMGPHIEIAGNNQPINIHWDFMKLRGPVETEFGDIAVLVRLFQSDGSFIQGIGAIEAKRIAHDRANFPALDKRGISQIKAHLKSLPRSCVLLYDHQPIAGFLHNLPEYSNWHHFPPRHFPNETYAAIIPSDLLLASGKRNTLLYPLTVPFSFQLAWRFLRGFDLHFEGRHFKKIKDYTDNVGGFQFMIVASVIKGRDIQNPAFGDENISQRYERLE